MNKYDVLVIGSSPNALVAAALLSKGGKKTLLLEERKALGGPVQTEVFAPGFRADTGVMSCQLDPEIVAELGLSLDVVTRGSVTTLGDSITTVSSASPLPLPTAISDAVSILRALYRIEPPDLWGARNVRASPPVQGARNVRASPPVQGARNVGFAPVPCARESEASPQFDARDSDLAPLRAVATHLLQLRSAETSAQTAAVSLESAATIGNAAAMGNAFTQAESANSRAAFEVLRLLFLSVRDYAQEITLNEVHAGILAGASVRCLSEGPFAPGTLFNFLHHEAVFDGLFRSTTQGGLSALVTALESCAAGFGAEIKKGVRGPLQVVIENGVATGVLLKSGEFIGADAIVSDLDAHHTFTKLIAPYAMGPEVNRAVRHVRCRGTVARVHLGLRELPTFAGVDEAALTGTLVMGAGVTALEKAWDAAKRGTMPASPYIEVAIPTLLDRTLVDEAGNHVLTAWVEYVPKRVTREAVLAAVTSSLVRFAPGIEPLIEHSHVALPSDLESHFGLYGGHLYGGEATLAQTFFARPFPGCSGSASPVENLFLSGSSAHPGGYSGLGGYHAARRLLARHG